MEGSDGFEEDLPGGKDDIARQGQEVGEKCGSLRGRLACGLPGRFDEIEDRMPSEGEQV